MNRLYYGDNLDILRKEIKDGSVGLIYLDPPFNSNRAYNLRFKTPKGHESDERGLEFVMATVASIGGALIRLRLADIGPFLAK